MRKQVAVNERGLRIGEDHRLAKLTNDEVDQLLALRDEGWSYRQLAETFEISKSSVAMIVKGRRRCQVVVRWKMVHVTTT